MSDSAKDSAAQQAAAAARRRQEEIEAERQRELAEQRRRALEQQRQRELAAEQAKKASTKLSVEASSSKHPVVKPESAPMNAPKKEAGAFMDKLMQQMFTGFSLDGNGAKKPEANGVNPADGNKPGDNTNKPAPPPELNKQAVAGIVDEMHTALTGQNADGKKAGDGKTNETKAEQLVSGLTQEQKRQVEDAYKNQYKKTILDTAGDKLNETDKLKLQSVLQKPDDGPNYAGDLAVMISQTHKNQDSGNSEIMKYLSTMNADQIATMQKQYQQNYGQSFDKALHDHGQLGQEIQHALPILLKGADKRTAEDDKQLVQIAAQYTGHDGVALVSAALSGNSKASAGARAAVSSDKDLMKKLESGYGGQQLAEIKDYVSKGEVSLTTALNADDKKKNPNDVTVALQTASDQEKQQYIIGEGLAKSGGKPTDDAGKQALQFYNDVNKALKNAGDDKQVSQWQQQLTGDSLTSKLAANASSSSQLARTVESMSQQDWQQLTNPQTGQAYRAQLVETVKGFTTPEQQKQLFDLLSQKAQAKTFAGSQQVNLPFDQAVATDKSPANVTFAVQHLNQKEAEQYKTDPKFRQQVDSVVNGLNDPTAKELSQSLLKQVEQTGKQAVPTSTDTALSDIVTNADKATTVSDIQKAIKENPNFLKDFADNQKVSEMNARLGDSPKMTPELEKQLQSMPSGKLSSAEQAISDYINKNLGDQASAFLNSGTLSIKEQQSLGFNKDQINSNLLDANSADRTAYLNSLKPEEKQQAEKAMLTSIQNLNAADAAKYKNDANYKKQVDGAVANLGGDGQALAHRLLDQVEKTGKPAVPDSVDKALLDIVGGADKTTTLQDIQKAISEDPSVVKDFGNYQKANELNNRLQNGGHITPELEKQLQAVGSGTLSPAEQALFNYAQKNMGSDQATNLFTTGKIPLDEQLNLGFPKDSVYAQLSTATPSEQKAVLDKLDPQQKQLAQAYIDGHGKASVADQIRSYVLGNGKDSAAIGNELATMTPQQKSEAINEYAQKYGGSLSGDFLSKLPADQQKNFEDLLSQTQVQGQTDYAQELEKGSDYQHNVEDGSAYTAIRASDMYATALQQANMIHQAMTPEQIATLNSTMDQAQQDYKAAVDKYDKDHPGFWSQVEHVAEQVAVVAVSTAVTIGVGALTCGVGGAIAGGLTYALLSQAVDVANGGKWDWTSFGEQAAMGVVFAGGGAALGLAKGVVMGAAEGVTESAATAAGETLIAGGAREAATAAGGNVLRVGAEDAAASGTSRAATSVAEQATAGGARSAGSSVASSAGSSVASTTDHEFATKLANIAAKHANNALKAAGVGGVSNVGITAGTDLVTGRKITAGELVQSFKGGAIGGLEFAVAGEAIGSGFARAGLLPHEPVPELSKPSEWKGTQLLRGGNGGEVPAGSTASPESAAFAKLTQAINDGAPISAAPEREVVPIGSPPLDSAEVSQARAGHDAIRDHAPPRAVSPDAAPEPIGAVFRRAPGNEQSPFLENSNRLGTVQIGDHFYELNPGGQEVPVGRFTSGIPVNSAVSQEHAFIGADKNGIYIRENPGHFVRNGTYVNGERLTPGVPRTLNPGDRVQLGNQDIVVQPTPVKLGLPEDYHPSSEAVSQSQYFAEHDKITLPLKDGFTSPGREGRSYDASGNLTDKYNVATVVDRAHDPVLRAVIADAKARFGNLPPREQAVALNNYCNKLLKPANMTESQLDEWYNRAWSQRGGEKVLLGNFIREGKGVCEQQALLYKVLGDELGLNTTVVLGAGAKDSLSINHAWNTVRFNDNTSLDFNHNTVDPRNFVVRDVAKSQIFDPRQQIYGKNYSEVYAHEQGIDLKNARPKPVTIGDGRFRVMLNDNQEGVAGRLSFDLPPEEARQVSRKQMDVRYQDGQLVIRDHLNVDGTGSSNGTWVNGRRLAPHEWYQLQPGDRVTAGANGPELRLGKTHNPMPRPGGQGQAVRVGDAAPIGSSGESFPQSERFQPVANEVMPEPGLVASPTYADKASDLFRSLAKAIGDYGVTGANEHVVLPPEHQFDQQSAAIELQPPQVRQAIREVRSAHDVSSLNEAMQKAAPYASNPVMREQVGKAVAALLEDRSIPFSQIRDLVDHTKGSAFDSIRALDGNRDFALINALKDRATYELSRRSNVYHDNSGVVNQVLQDVRNGAGKHKLDSHIANPIRRDLTPEEKAVALDRLSQENAKILDGLFADINEQHGTTSNSDVKRFENILDKSTRKDCLEKAAERGYEFQVENVKDSVRGQVTTTDVGSMRDIVNTLSKNGVQIVKADTNMLLEPKMTGWRGVNLDVRFPNGQLGEIQMRVHEIQQVPANHEDYEFLRKSDPQSAEHQLRKAKINGIFQAAWDKYLQRTGQTEETISGYMDEIQQSLNS